MPTRNYQGFSIPASLSIIADARLKTSFAFWKSPLAPASRNQPYTVPEAVDNVSATNAPSVPACTPRTFSEIAATDTTGISTFLTSPDVVLIPSSLSLPRAARKSVCSTLLRSVRHKLRVSRSSADREATKCSITGFSTSSNRCSRACACKAGILPASSRSFSSTTAPSAAAALNGSKNIIAIDCAGTFSRDRSQQLKQAGA